MTFPLLEEGLISIMGIDPGTNTLGVSRLDIDPKTLRLVTTHAITYQADKCFRYTEYEKEDAALMRYARLAWHEENLKQIFMDNEPFQLAVESNFMNIRNASAYGPLVESMSAIRRAYYAYDNLRKLHLVTPAAAKKSVGAPTRGGGKEVVTHALKKMHQLLGVSKTYLDTLDEHAIDAIAIGFHRYTELYNQVMQLKIKPS